MIQFFCENNRFLKELKKLGNLSIDIMLGNFSNYSRHVVLLGQSKILFYNSFMFTLLLFDRNSILSKAYGGTWFRSNFQDLFSYRGAQKLEWFEVLEGNDCSPVPATVNAGKPPRDICNDALGDERRCICINTGRNVDSETGYEAMCGNCRDPCQLKFTPDTVPRYLQRLAAQEVDNDFEEY